MGTWLNADGLYIKYGVDEAVQNTGGGVKAFGKTQLVEFTVTAADLTASVGSVGFLSDTVFLPKNAYIESVEIFVETAFAGAGATLDIGLYKKDRTTALSANGLAAAVATASLTAGASVAGAGALVKTRTAEPALITYRKNTANFTAGKAVIRINYFA